MKKTEQFDEDDPKAYKDMPVPDKVQSIYVMEKPVWLEVWLTSYVINICTMLIVNYAYGVCPLLDQ